MTGGWLSGNSDSIKLPSNVGSYRVPQEHMSVMGERCRQDNETSTSEESVSSGLTCADQSATSPMSAGTSVLQEGSMVPGAFVPTKASRSLEDLLNGFSTYDDLVHHPNKIQTLSSVT